MSFALWACGSSVDMMYKRYVHLFLNAGCSCSTCGSCAADKLIRTCQTIIGSRCLILEASHLHQHPLLFSAIIFAVGVSSGICFNILFYILGTLAPCIVLLPKGNLPVRVHS
jgi:hypothetical protein